MRKWIGALAALALLVCAFAPQVSFTEDVGTVMLALAIYALARNDSYDAKLALGTVVMNRVDSPWFGDTLGEVLDEQHQFPAGDRYDAESLAAAHEVLAGRRTLDAGTVYYRSAAATERRDDPPVSAVGGFLFYATDTAI